MMNSTGLGLAHVSLWGIHIIAVVAFFVGVLLLVHWAVKKLDERQVRGWGIGLVAAGTVLCLLTIATLPLHGGMGGGRMKCAMMEGGMKGGMMDDMMGGMMDDDDMDHDGMDMMEMSMDDMAGMLDGKTGDAFDAAFLEGMIPHHQGAIDMAEAALENAKHEEIKAMARAIIDAQQREIDQMRGWQRAWGYEE